MPMTTEEENGVIGRDVMAHAETRKRLAALDCELHDALEWVRNAEGILKTSTLQQVDAYLEKWPTADKIKSIIHETREKQAEQEQREKRMKDYGIQF